MLALQNSPKSYVNNGKKHGWLFNFQPPAAFLGQHELSVLLGFSLNTPQFGYWSEQPKLVLCQTHCQCWAWAGCPMLRLSPFLFLCLFERGVLILSQAGIQHIGQYLKRAKHSGTLGLKKSTMHVNICLQVSTCHVCSGFAVSYLCNNAVINNTVSSVFTVMQCHYEDEWQGICHL